MFFKFLDTIEKDGKFELQNHATCPCIRFCGRPQIVDLRFQKTVDGYLVPGHLVPWTFGIRTFGIQTLGKVPWVPNGSRYQIFLGTKCPGTKCPGYQISGYQMSIWPLGTKCPGTKYPSTVCLHDFFSVNSNWSNSKKFFKNGVNLRQKIEKCSAARSFPIYSCMVFNFKNVTKFKNYNLYRVRSRARYENRP